MKSQVEIWREQGLNDKQIWKKLKDKLSESLNIVFDYLKKTGKISRTLELLFKLGIFLIQNKILFSGIKYTKGKSLTLYFGWQQYNDGISIKHLDKEKPLSNLDAVCTILGYFPKTVGFITSKNFWVELNISKEFSSKHGKKEFLINNLVKTCQKAGVQLIS